LLTYKPLFALAPLNTKAVRCYFQDSRQYQLANNDIVGKTQLCRTAILSRPNMVNFRAIQCHASDGSAIKVPKNKGMDSKLKPFEQVIMLAEAGPAS